MNVSANSALVYNAVIIGGVMKQLLFTLLVLIITACSNAPEPQIFHISGATMGTGYNVRWVASADQSEAVKTQVDERLAEINRVMSTYDPQSELSLLNQRRDTPFRQTVSADLAEVLGLSLMLYQHSGGLFDVTVGPLVNLWGFGPAGDVTMAPSDEDINLALEQTGADAIRLDGAVLSLQSPRYIDLSAIAKGWGVDEIAQLLESLGHRHYLVEIGGEIRVSGAKPGDIPWRIAIERPQQSLQQQAQLILEPGNRAVATSGDYRNFFVADGVRYSHTISPLSGKPVEHSLASVSVIHESAALADGWATALTVAGPQQAMALATEHQLAVYMIIRGESDYHSQASPLFKTWFPSVAAEIH